MQNISITLKPFQPVLSQVVSTELNNLWNLLWNDLKGQATWSESKGFKFYPRWGVYDQILSCDEIEGSLNKKPYQINFVGVSAGYVEILLSDIRFRFSSNSNYGHFKTSTNSIYLTGGAACYTTKPDQIGIDEWMENPYRNNNTPFLMTPDKEAEAASFLRDLISTIQSSRE